MHSLWRSGPRGLVWRRGCDQLRIGPACSWYLNAIATGRPLKKSYQEKTWPTLAHCTKKQFNTERHVYRVGQQLQDRSLWPRGQVHATSSSPFFSQLSDVLCSRGISGRDRHCGPNFHRTRKTWSCQTPCHPGRSSPWLKVFLLLLLLLLSGLTRLRNRLLEGLTEILAELELG